MTGVDLDAPATLSWRSREVPHERRLRSVREAARVAMKDLKRGEFFSATITTTGQVFSGDEIVEIFQTGGLARRGYARF